MPHWEGIYVFAAWRLSAECLGSITMSEVIHLPSSYLIAACALAEGRPCLFGNNRNFDHSRLAKETYSHLRTRLMKIALALLLAFPTFGLSIVVLLVYMFFKTKNVKNAIETAVEMLSAEESKRRVCIDGLSYIQAYAYLHECGKITQEINGLCNYSVCINGNTYRGTLTREPNGSNALLSATNMNWRGVVRDWIAEFIAPCQAVPSLSGIEKMTHVGHDWTAQTEIMTRVRYIPEELFNCPKLEHIYFQDSAITTIPKGIGRCFHLEHLLLINSSLHEIPPEIGCCEQLKELLIANSKISEMPTEVCSLPFLERMTLADSCLHTVPSQIGTLRKVKFLMLHGNAIEHLPQEIGLLKELDSLHLSKNKLSNLPREIWGLPRLRRFSIAENEFKVLPPGLCKLGSLESLDISENKLTWLPDELGEMSSLKELHVFGNPLAGLPASIVKLDNLELLSLGFIPNLVLSAEQLTWIERLLENGCAILLQYGGFDLGEEQFQARQIQNFNNKLKRKAAVWDAEFPELDE